MALLSVLALGMLSLSTISLRANSRHSAEYEARCNARMAMMIAIGQLQRQVGPDQRITANASIMSDPDSPAASDILHPHWTGVWESWKAGSASVSGGDEPSAHSTLGTSATGMHPVYSANKRNHFRAWLASMPEAQSVDIEAAKSFHLDATLTPEVGDKAVKLVAGGSLGSSADVKSHVSAALIDVDSGGRGRYGWWVGDQSVKASIMSDAYEGQSLAAADRIYRHQAPGSTGTLRAAGLENTEGTGIGGAPTLKSLDLIGGAQAPSQLGFHDLAIASKGVLADVREGGLKRDLSTILERKIDVAENGDDFMLYRFKTGRDEMVPIQDLSAYYQLYQDDPEGSLGRKGGIKYGSNQLPGAIQVQAPDFGSPADRTKTVREYTTLYRNPVPIRIQYILALTAVPFDQSMIDPRVQAVTYDPKHTHLLIPGVMPVVTLWNPNSVPLVMGGSPATSQVFSMGGPPINFTFSVKRAGGLVQKDGAITLNYMNVGNSSSNGTATNDADYGRVLNLRFGKDSPVVFEPGETKVFTIPDTASTNDLLRESTNGGTNIARYLHDAVNTYNPFGFYSCYRSATTQYGTSAAKYSSNGAPFCYPLPPAENNQGTAPIYIGVGVGDTVYLDIGGERPASGKDAGTNMARASEICGAGFQFSLTDNDNFSPPVLPPAVPAGNIGVTQSDHIRHYQFLSRFGGDPRNTTNIAFNGKLIDYGFPGGKAPISGAANPVSVTNLIGAAGAGEVVPVAMFTMRAGCEAHSVSAGGYAGGRSVCSTRPFLHAGIIAPPFVDSNNPEDLYNYGWDWSVERINSVEEAIQVEPGTGRNYYGGGYTAERGATHIVQQEIPVLPPISIASLSHAQLGGFSLANRPYVGEADQFFKSYIWLVGIFSNYPENRDPSPSGDSYRRITAMGMGGMYPTVMQAIGNSYANPGLPPDSAFRQIQRTFDTDAGAEERIFADHSYLANKALWDEFFFSSLVPKPAGVKLYGEDQAVGKVAADFFFGGKHLPNRRMLPHSAGLDENALAGLVATKDQYLGGLADKLARHLMVSGAFNVNSTSVEAWRIVLSSLRGKPIQYLGKKAGSPTEVVPRGTPVGFGSLPGGAPVDSGTVENPNAPEPWSSWRELSDKEIDELAVAMVRQVKLRGPFLSLSEFVNRRLDANNKDLSVKGALQAALDDTEVSINKAFRSKDRMLDGEPDLASAAFAFKEAAQGPVAYGSSAYVDQADVLRNLAEQLTPRGDTFVIRAYGDSLAASGKVAARAWCEATVQRTPEYLDPSDKGEVRQSDLASEANKRFGREIRIVSFRWLSSGEI